MFKNLNKFLTSFKKSFVDSSCANNNFDINKIKLDSFVEWIFCDWVLRLKEIQRLREKMVEDGFKEDKVKELIQDYIFDETLKIYSNQDWEFKLVEWEVTYISDQWEISLVIDLETVNILSTFWIDKDFILKEFNSPISSMKLEELWQLEFDSEEDAENQLKEAWFNIVYTFLNEDKRLDAIYWSEEEFMSKNVKLSFVSFFKDWKIKEMKAPKWELINISINWIDFSWMNASYVSFIEWALLIDKIESWDISLNWKINLIDFSWMNAKYVFFNSEWKVISIKTCNDCTINWELNWINMSGYKAMEIVFDEFWWIFSFEAPKWEVLSWEYNWIKFEWNNYEYYQFWWLSWDNFRKIKI